MGKSADLNEFVPWTKVAPRGDRMVYHVGNLAEDAHEEAGSPYVRCRQSEAAGVKNAAWAAFLDGLVLLVQRRVHGKAAFEYIAVKV